MKRHAIIFLGFCLGACAVYAPLPNESQQPPLRVEQTGSDPIHTQTPLTTPASPQPPAQNPASVITHSSAVRGGVAWVTLPHQGVTPPSINYGQRPVAVLRQANSWVAVVGIPLEAKLGSHRLIDQQTGTHYSFEVRDKKYEVQRIRLSSQRHVNPSQADLERIALEARLTKAALATPWRPSAIPPLPLIQPIQGRISSTFGLRRFFNGQARSPHRGIDIAAPKGTPIASAADGIVVELGNFFYSGNTLFIDHGQGVVTMYGHMNTIVVNKGQMVSKGQTIGTVGMTGRATGPHLHWAVSLNNTLINPLLLVQSL